MAAEFEVYKDRSGEYRWRLQANNNEIVADSNEGYSSKRAALDAVEVVRKIAAGALVKELAEIRNAPGEEHRRLKAAAVTEGKALSGVAPSEFKESLDRPTRRELIARVQARDGAVVSHSPADAVRAERDAR